MEVSPSLLAADFLNLESEIDMINSSVADYLHLDVMDGVFVPNISFGFSVLNALGNKCKKPMDVHLMIVEPEKWISQVRDCGAHLMNVHYEACRHLHSTIWQIHQAGMKAGVTLNPSTPVTLLADIIQDLDLVLLMSVNPGFGGQPFIRHTLEKVKELRKLINLTGSPAKIEIDGGVNERTGTELAIAGADILVAGSYIFGAPDPHERIAILKNLNARRPAD